MNPPVDAPASSTRRPRTSIAHASSAASSFSPPRDTNRAGVAGDHDRLGRARPGATRRVAGAPPTVTSPASITSTARARLGTNPRRTSSASSRRRNGPRTPRAGRDRRRRLLRRLLGGLRRASSTAVFLAAFFFARLLRVLGRRLRRRLRGGLRLLRELRLELDEVVLGGDAHRLHLALDLLAHRVHQHVGAAAAPLDETVDEALDLVLGELALLRPAPGRARAPALRVSATNSAPASRYLVRSGVWGMPAPGVRVPNGSARPAGGPAVPIAAVRRRVGPEPGHELGEIVGHPGRRRVRAPARSGRARRCRSAPSRTASRGGSRAARRSTGGPPP